MSAATKDGIRARICLRAGSSLDSTNVLGSRGAESLIGNGDLLFSVPNNPRLFRVQAAATSLEESASVSEELTRNRLPAIASELWQSLVKAAARLPRSSCGDDDDDDDDMEEDEDDGYSQDRLYRQALEVWSRPGGQALRTSNAA